MPSDHSVAKISVFSLISISLPSNDLSLEKSLFTLSWYVIELFCCKQQAKGGPSVWFFFFLLFAPKNKGRSA